MISQLEQQAYLLEYNQFLVSAIQFSNLHFDESCFLFSEMAAFL